MGAPVGKKTRLERLDRWLTENVESREGRKRRWYDVYNLFIDRWAGNIFQGRLDRMEEAGAEDTRFACLETDGDELRVFAGFVHERRPDGSYVIVYRRPPVEPDGESEYVALYATFDTDGYSPYVVKFSALSLEQQLELYPLFTDESKPYLVWPEEPPGPTAYEKVSDDIDRLDGMGVLV